MLDQRLAAAERGRVREQLQPTLGSTRAALAAHPQAASSRELPGPARHLRDQPGSAASINVQDEAQKKLDVLSNEILMEANAWGGHLA